MVYIRGLQQWYISEVCSSGVSLENDWRGDAWEAVGEADVPCVVIHGHLENFREGELEVLMDFDLVRERVVGGCAVGK